MTEETPLTPLEARRLEVQQYQNNIAMYEALVASLPKEWPSRLEHLRGSKNKHADSAKIADLDDVTLLADLWYADECRDAIRSETVEMRKAAAILSVMEQQAK